MSYESKVAVEGAATTLIGESPVMSELREDVLSAARTHATVLILGETGSGKEVVARMIHEQSPRSTSRFVAVNCSGIPETLLESELFVHTKGSFTGAYRDKIGLVRQADRGTLFLDELGEMSLRMQATLLRFTETGEIQPVGAERPTARTDVRLITATNRDLWQRIQDGEFREDLFYRLNVIQLRVPPLRERGADILLLVEHYLAQAARTHRLAVPELTTDAAALLEEYRWPGNVRELRNVTERLVLKDRRSRLTPDDLPEEVLRPAGARAGRQAHPAESGPETLRVPASPVTDRLWERMLDGEDFWSVVGAAFKARELTRADLAAIVDRGLSETNGSYRSLVRMVNLPESDYKRFHAFLYQQKCNLPVAPYRAAPARRLPASRPLLAS
jgi:DNA-binding NtrC family response regulator